MQPLRKRFISRRTALRGALGGAGFAISLPLLEAMLDDHGEAFAGGEPLPKRFVTWLFSNGVLLDRFEPSQTGSTWSLSEQLEPLEGVKDYINLCTGFMNHGMVGGYISGHVEGITGFTGYPYAYTGFGYDAGGPSIDQVIADTITANTPVSSLQVAVSKANTFAGSGPLGSAISFRGTPGSLVSLAPITSPKQVWNSLFGVFPGPDAPEDFRLERGLMLDAVREQSDKLRARLGVADQQRLDAHLEGVEELQTKVSALPPSCIMPDEPDEENDEPVGSELIGPVNEIMAELMTYALRCDITRVASMTFLGLAGETPYTEIGIPTSKHLLSHDAQYSPNAREQLHQSIVYEMERLAVFLQFLRDSVDVTGHNLLDSTIVYATSDCSVGWLHSISRQPVILVGTGGGTLQYPGVHVQAIENNPDDPNGEQSPDMPAARNLSDIALTCLKAFDPTADSFGGGGCESDTLVSEILA
ncbi:MAG TPA: DUF1552 domain-containing protein [Nannocystaceae bacterium]|nr:DUF1552 domain-containing protein [Nannocystaceae bacterium]